MKRVAIVGIGHGKFGVRSDASLRELAFEAGKVCLDDAGLSIKEVDSMVTGIVGLGLATDTMRISERGSLTSIQASREASKAAYKMAGVGPSDIDIATVHDCFTIAEIVAYEDLGFCEKGEGGRLIEAKETYVGGRIPVNVDGGLKAKGHPLGATGVSMTIEITKQLRGEAGERQVKNAEIGLAHNVGGS